ncbi:Transcriptional regulator [Vibrio chagasii]|nr:Transcriptional regulator [Vibrio chagasii]
MTVSFSHFLKDLRDSQDLTQQDVIDKLISADIAFEKLDLTTYSRWERGVTAPKLEKQLLIARVMGADVAQLIDPEAKAPIKKMNNFKQVRSRTLNPYSSDSNKFTTYHYESLTDEPELCQKLKAFHVDYLGMNIGLSDFQNRHLMLEIFVDELGKLVGHLLYGYLDTSALPSQYVPDKLSECHFIVPQEDQDTNLTMYIISAYSSLASPRMAIILMILDMLRQNINIKDLQVNCHDQEGYSLYESNSDCELINKGESLPFGGVKVYGKHFRYVRIKVNAESILASKVVSDIVPFTSEYIQSLLDNHS